MLKLFLFCLFGLLFNDGSVLRRDCCENSIGALDDAVEKEAESEGGRYEEHEYERAHPGEVEGERLAEIRANQVEWLRFE